MNIYLPQGWTHFTVGIPLPVRVGKNIQYALRDLESLCQGLQILPGQLMMVWIANLGICPQENHEAIHMALKKIIPKHQQFKLIAKRWVVEEHEDHCSIWLEFKDRFEQFSDLQKQCNTQLQRYGFHLDHVNSPRILCAKIKNKPTSSFPAPMRIQMWTHFINIYQRPHTYLPFKGYECVTSFALATEQQMTHEESDEILLSDQEQHVKQTEHDRILTRLEERLTYHHQTQQKYKNKPRKRLRRRRKPSSHKESR